MCCIFFCKLIKSIRTHLHLMAFLYLLLGKVPILFLIYTCYYLYTPFMSNLRIFTINDIYSLIWLDVVNITYFWQEHFFYKLCKFELATTFSRRVLIIKQMEYKIFSDVYRLNTFQLHKFIFNRVIKLSKLTI